MNCRVFNKQLPMLLDRNPDDEAVRELLAHASSCPDCANELAEAKAAMAALRPSRRISASGRFKERTMQRIMQIEAEEVLSPARPVHKARPARRSLFITFAAAAAVILFAVGVLDWRSGSGSAFAQVIEQIAKARTVTYVLTTSTPGTPELRMESSYKDPGLLRTVGAGGQAVSVTDARKRKQILLFTSTKRYIETTLPESVMTTSPQQVNYVECLRSLTADRGVPIGNKEVDGHQAMGFRADAGNVRFEIWADAKDYRIVRAEMEILSIPGSKGTLSEIHYDPQLDDSLFVTTPPKDYTAMAVNVDTSAANENDLISYLRMWASRTIDGSFPPPPGDTLALMKASRKLRKQSTTMSQDQLLQDTFLVTKGTMFATMMTPANDWHYAGEGVKLGEAGTAIAWWKPTGGEKYRVIFGDLSVRDAAPSQLPRQ